MAKRPIMNCYVIGDSADVAKTVAEYDVYAFADIVGDFCGVHLTEEYPKNTRLKKRIAQGTVSVGLPSTVTGYMVAKAPEAQCLPIWRHLRCPGLFRGHRHRKAGGA